MRCPGVLLAEYPRAQHILNLFCVFDRTSFTDDIDLNGPRVLHSAFDLDSDVASKFYGAEVINLLWPYNDADLTASTDGIGFVDTLKARCNVFELTHAFDKVFGANVARTWTSGAECIDDADDERFWRRSFHVVVVLFGSQGNLFGHAIFTSHLTTDVMVFALY